MNRKRLWLGASVIVVVAIVLGALWFARANSPENVANRYVTATSGDLSALQATTTQDSGASV